MQIKTLMKKISTFIMIGSFFINNLGIVSYAQNDVTNIEVSSNYLNIVVLKKYLLGIQNDISNVDFNADGNINVLDLIYLKHSLLVEDTPNTEGFVISEDKSICTFNGMAYIGFYLDETNSVTYCYVNGSLATGEVNIDDKFYFICDDGILRTGLQNTENGLEYRNEFSYLTTGWVKVDGSTYYFQENNIACKGVCLIDGDYYYFNRSNEKLVTNSVIGKWSIDANGIASSKLQSIANSRFNTGYQTLDKIYNLVRVGGYSSLGSSTDINGNSVGNGTASLTYKSGSSVTEQIVKFGPSSSVSATGWACFAQYRALNNKGCCFYMAVYFDYLCRYAGYESRIVYGTQGQGVHYWNQVKVDGSWLNYDCCSSGRCGLTNSQLLSKKSGFIWNGYIVPDEDYNGCYWYSSTTDYDNGNYKYLEH